jgi:hypothetical protein
MFGNAPLDHEPTVANSEPHFPRRADYPINVLNFYGSTGIPLVVTGSITTTQPGIAAFPSGFHAVKWLAASTTAGTTLAMFNWSVPGEYGDDVDELMWDMLWHQVATVNSPFTPSIQRARVNVAAATLTSSATAVYPVSGASAVADTTKFTLTTASGAGVVQRVTATFSAKGIKGKDSLLFQLQPQATLGAGDSYLVGMRVRIKRHAALRDRTERGV